MRRTITDKIDGITGMKGNQFSPTPPAPKSCKIELTAKCNYKCAFCATSSNLREKREMGWDFYCKLLKDLRKNGVEEAGMFYLGESFLVPWLPDAIRQAKKTGFPYVFLTTNGSLATPGRVDACMRAGLDSLKFSLNYADEDQFKSIARVKGGLFEVMIANIKDAHNIRETAGYGCGLFASYIDYDDEQGKRMKELVDELSPYLDEVYALPLYSQADLTGGANAKDGWRVRAGNPGRAGNMRAPVPCWSLFTEARVSWNGQLSACCFDHDNTFNMGDLNEISFMDAWHSEKFQELRAAHLGGNVAGTACETCAAYN